MPPAGTDFKELVDLLPQTVFEADALGNLTYANQHAFEAFGYSKEDVKNGLNVLQMVVPEYRGRALEHLGRVLRCERPDHTEYTALRKDGSIFPVSISANPIVCGDRVVGVRGIVADITSVRREQETLREATFRVSEERARLEGIIGAMGDGISIQDTELRILYQNQVHKNLIGDHVGEYCYTAYQKRDSVCEGCHLVMAFQDGNIHRVERTGRTANGTRFVEITGSPLWDNAGRIVAGIEIVRDITARKAAEEERQKLVALVEHSSDLIGMATMEERVIYLNSAGRRLVGLETLEQVQQTTVLDYFMKDDLVEFQEQVLKGIKDKGRWSGEFRLRHFKTGVSIPVEFNGFCIKDHGTGRPIALAAVCRDITERKKIELELQRSRNLESLGVLAGGVAHDFNNLLMAIQGNISLSKMHSEPGGKRFQRLEEAEKVCLLAQGLTQQLLTYSKGGAPVRRAASLRDLIEDSATFALRGSNVRCECSFSPDLWTVEVDRGQISQVVNNLVLNADQAMPGGGVVRIYGENITLGPEGPLPLLPLKEGDYVKISIRDEGIGIPPEYLGRIFDPYFTTKKKGSGLGLATVYSIIRKHEGYVTVESEMGVGTIFHVYLPASRNQAPPDGKLEETVCFGKGKVLVMDDEEIIRDVMSAMLTSLGFEVDVAPDGGEAIALYENARGAGKPYTAVIMDLTIPGGMGGLETIRRLKEIDPQVSAIVSSGYSHDPVLADYAKYGFRGMVKKPFMLQELSTELRRVMRER